MGAVVHVQIGAREVGTRCIGYGVWRCLPGLQERKKGISEIGVLEIGTDESGLEAPIPMNSPQWPRSLMTSLANDLAR